MDLGFEFALSTPEAAAGAVPVVNDDMISSLVISPDGWQAKMTVTGAVDGGAYSGLNNAVSPGLALTVTSKSWDASGDETTLQRTVIATTVIRQPYANGTLLQETEVLSDLEVVLSLSETIFVGETVTAVAAPALYTDNGAGGSAAVNSGGAIPTVTNGSTEAYRKPQLLWLDIENQRVTDPTWSPKLFAYHSAARNGQPVRAVRFIASDESGNSVQSLVTSLTTGAFTGTGYYANWFQPTWNLSSLVDGDYITVDAIVYPWVGDAFQLSIDGEVYPSPNISTLRAVCDIGGSWNTVYVFIDGVGAGSPQASTNEATARANPYADIAGAAQAGKAANLAANGSNTLSGVEIVISAGVTYEGAMSGFMAGSMDKFACVMRGDDATSRWGDPSIQYTSTNIPPKLHIRDLILRKNSSLIWMRGDNTVGGLLTATNVTFELNTGQGVSDFWTLRFGRGQIVNCTGAYTGFGNQFGSNVGGTMLTLGSTFVPLNAYNAVSCRHTLFRFTSGVQLGQPNGCVCAFGFYSKSGNSGPVIYREAVETGDMGFAIVGNVGEIYGAVGVQAAFYIAGDSDVTPMVNCTESMNTVVGQRSNVAYQDLGTVEVEKQFISKLSFHWQWNSKSDYFFATGKPADGDRTGNWAVRHGVDTKPMAINWTAGDQNYGFNSWLGEALGDTKANNEGPNGHVFGVFSAITPDWVNDQSSDVVGTGDGDYTPGALNNLPTVPAGQTEFAVDMKGRPIPTDGTAVVGALQLTT